MVKQQMLVRRPVADVFDAFVNPEVTTKFWFTKSSGKLETGKTVRWEWEMYGLAAEVRVIAMEPQQRILVEWDDPPMPIEWLFSERPGRTTLVTISNWGFRGTEDEIVAQALDSMGGFSFVLAGLKAWLEHQVRLNLVGDHHPEAQHDNPSG
jgi:uncharacterized protein YndB with AHSA1/START domain